MSTTFSDNHQEPWAIKTQLYMDAGMNYNTSAEVAYPEKIHKTLAFKHISGCIPLPSLESRNNCNHCRACNIWVRIPHNWNFLDSEKHAQKVQVLESYTTYAKFRGFDVESETHLPNLIFILTAMSAKTLGGINCLLVVLNIVDLTKSI